MSAKIQHRILNAELAPPAEAWRVIARRLDEEFDPAEIIVAEKLDDASLTPPSNAWSFISQNLGEEAEEQPAPQAKVISINLRRWAVAASIAALVIVGVIYLGRFLVDDNIAITTPATTPNAPDTRSSVPVSEMPDVSDMQTAISGLIPRRTRVQTNRPATQAVYIPPIDSPFEIIEDPGPEPELTTIELKKSDIVEGSQDIIVAAPPIRDTHGKIILNKELLTAEAPNYITVTSPNGEQTRISSKFVNQLVFLNNNPRDREQYLDFLFRQSTTWKKRFEDWRTRLMQDPNFLPSSATFFDVLELWELVKE